MFIYTCNDSELYEEQIYACQIFYDILASF